jgi:ribulose-5-phosphate 4-epimerase/fuculose-1-phosphate aldolase
MKVVHDGIIKYDRTNFSQCPPLPIDEYSKLEYWRKKLYLVNLIGEYKEEKIGFGNVSLIQDYSKLLKTTNPQFIITATQTGKYSNLNGEHYTRILDFSINELKVQMQGPVEASSEVITHAAIYAQNSDIKAIFHVHSAAIWKLMIEENFSFTAENIPYGTLEMAKATQECVGKSNFGLICMRGHADGVVAYGRTPEEAWKYLMQLYERTI